MASSALAPVRRWSAKRKADLVLSIRRGDVEREEAKSFHGISEEEMQEWESGENGRMASRIRERWER